jgi:hypothetical protein
LEGIVEEAIRDGRSIVKLKPTWKLTKLDIEKIKDEIIEYNVQMKSKVVNKQNKEVKGVFRLQNAEDENGEITVREYFKDQPSREFSEELDGEIWENFAGDVEIYGTHKDPKVIKERGFLSTGVVTLFWINYLLLLLRPGDNLSSIEDPEDHFPCAYIV